jgi:hypothetical protein
MVHRGYRARHRVDRGCTVHRRVFALSGAAPRRRGRSASGARRRSIAALIHQVPPTRVCPAPSATAAAAGTRRAAALPEAPPEPPPAEIRADAVKFAQILRKGSRTLFRRVPHRHLPATLTTAYASAQSLTRDHGLGLAAIATACCLPAHAQRRAMPLVVLLTAPAETRCPRGRGFLWPTN